MKDTKTRILFSALFKYNGNLRDCINYIKDTYLIKPGYSLYGKDYYMATVTIFENKANNPNSFTIIVDKEFFETSYYALLNSYRTVLAYILIYVMERNFKEVVDLFKNDDIINGAEFINTFVDKSTEDYETKDIIKAAINNSDIDIEKLCESLNL